MSPDVLASDIDRTLLWSRARSGVPEEALTDLVCAEVLQDRDHAFVTPTAWAAIERLAADDSLVLVTTRTPAQVLRLGLPAFRRILCLNGGALLLDGVPDPRHARETTELVSQLRPMTEFAQRVQHLAEAPHVRGLRDADGHFGYFLLTGDPVPPAWSEELAALAAEDAWVLTAEQTKIYAMPSTLTKESGLERILNHSGGELVAAAGDSQLDAGMLRLARHALVPRGSYLHQQGWDAGLTVAEGVLAGEEIALWLDGFLAGSPLRAT